MGPLQVPDQVLEHSAVLSFCDGTPISKVIETYRGEALALRSPVCTRWEAAKPPRLAIKVAGSKSE